MLAGLGSTYYVPASTSLDTRVALTATVAYTMSKSGPTTNSVYVVAPTIAGNPVLGYIASQGADDSGTISGTVTITLTTRYDSPYPITLRDLNILGYGEVVGHGSVAVAAVSSAPLGETGSGSITAEVQQLQLNFVH